jgi:hypothetical protein
LRKNFWPLGHTQLDDLGVSLLILDVLFTEQSFLCLASSGYPRDSQLTALLRHLPVEFCQKLKNLQLHLGVDAPYPAVAAYPDQVEDRLLHGLQEAVSLLTKLRDQLVFWRAVGYASHPRMCLQ